MVTTVEKSLDHRHGGKGIQFLALPLVTPAHEAVSQSTGDFVDQDGTITASLYYYIRLKNLLPHLH